MAVGLGSAACTSASGADARAGATTTSAGRSALASLVFDASRDIQRARAEVVQTCMREQGFSYEIPLIDPGTAATGAGDRDYVERYGYGILLPPPEPSPPPDVLRDAEQRLTPDEADAYFRALLGSASPEAAPSPGSCLGRGDALVIDLAERLADPAVAAAIGEFDAAVLADPRTVAAEDGWTGCMRAQGYEVSSRDEIVAELVALAGRGLAGADLAAAQRRELALAGADFACSAPVDEVRRTVERDLAPRFIARLEPMLVP